MSLVIGVRTKDAVVIASDGLALISSEKENLTKKLYTYPKLKVIKPWNILLGYIGSTEICFEVISPLTCLDKLTRSKQSILNANTAFNTDKQFLDALSGQVKSINENNQDSKFVLIAGYYFAGGSSGLSLFHSNGKISAIDKYICLGSGADNVSCLIRDKYLYDSNTLYTVNYVIDLIYKGSEIPTVNFLPMISILTRDKVFDYSERCIDLFNEFKIDLKSRLLFEHKKDLKNKT